MEPLSVTQVLTAIRGSMVGRCDPPSFKGVSTDTRTLAPGDLFFALKGPNFDGHAYVAQAKASGAAGAVISDDIPGLQSVDGFALLRVPDSGRALLELGRFYRSQFQVKVIAITGSNGKTTTKELIGSALSAVAPTIRSEKSFNNRIGLPLTLFRIEKDTKYAVVEIGTSAPGEIAELAEVARPDVAIITNIAESHLEGLGDIDGVCQEKASLLDSLSSDGLAILNADDQRFDVLLERAPGRTVSYGFVKNAVSESTAAYRATSVDCGLSDLSFLYSRVEPGQRPNPNPRAWSSVRVPLTGCHNVSNVLATMAVCGELGLPNARITEALRRFEGPPGRLRPLQGRDVFILDDSYNANPGSVIAALNTFSILDVPGRKVLVLGDMCELGEQSEVLHQKVGAELYAGRFDALVTVGPECEALVQEALTRGFHPEDVDVFATVDEALRFLPSLIQENDSILVKGSRAVGLDRAVTLLKSLKVRNSWSQSAELGSGLQLRA